MDDEKPLPGAMPETATDGTIIIPDYESAPAVSENVLENAAPPLDPTAAAKKKRLQLAIGAVLLLCIVVVITDTVTKSCSNQLPATPCVDAGEPAAGLPATPEGCGVLPALEPSACYKAALRSLVGWIKENPGLGVIVVIFVYAAASVMFIPGSILTLSVGAAFASALGLTLGVLLGALAVFLGATLGAALSFLLARFVFADMAAEMMVKYPTMGSVDKALASNGLKMVVLMRLTPVVPFGAMNYISGATSLEFQDFVVGSVGMLPGCIAYVYLGAAAGNAATGGGADGSLVKSVIGVIGAIAAVVVVGFVAKEAKKEMDAVVAAAEEADRQAAGAQAIRTQ